MPGALEAAQTEYPFFCLVCGYHPPVIFFDANAKTAFDLRKGEKAATSSNTSTVIIDEFWSDVRLGCLEYARFGVNTSRISLNSIGNLMNLFVWELMRNSTMAVTPFPPSSSVCAKSGACKIATDCCTDCRVSSEF